MPKGPIPLPAPPDTAEKQLTLPDRAQHITINTATRRPIPKARGPRPAKTPMAALRPTRPAREHPQQAPTAAAHIMPKGQERRPLRAPTVAPRPTTRESARSERLPQVRLHTPVTITTVRQLRFTIHRLSSTPTLRVAITAEAGPQLVQQSQAPPLAQ